MKERGILSPSDLRKPLNKAVYGLMVLCIAVMVVTMLYPIAMTLFNGLKSNPEVNSFPPRFSRRSGIGKITPEAGRLSICRLT
ncbi:hypothetical protein HMSSN036_37680 [Paenibacillus macerans]|nr:hypothetical protein HMSSN036_37680 [Paenibacillus macerans]